MTATGGVFYTTPDILDMQGNTIQPSSVRKLGAGTVYLAGSGLNVTGLTFDSAGNLYFGVEAYVPVRIELMRLSPGGSLADLGQIVDTSAGYISQVRTALAASPAGATHFRVTPSASSVTAGSAITLTVTALDSDNNTDTGYRGTVHFASSDGAPTLPADYAFTAAENGVHTFTGLILRTVGDTGNQTISATDTATSSITGTATIMVKPGVATHFRLSAPAEAVAGTRFAITVTARDAFDNTATGYTGTVRFTSTDGQASVPNPSMLTNGAGTFSVTLKTAGAQMVFAADGSITAGATVHVSPAAATHFRVAAPGTVVAGTPFAITVTAVDPFNNVDINYDGTIFFTSSDNLAILPGFSTLTNGTRNFSVALRTAGNQTVNAIDFFHNSINGSAIVNVSPAAAGYFRVTAPSNTTAGVAFNLMVFALDPYNNLATSYLGTVHFSSSDGQASLPANSRLTNGSGTFPVTLKTAGSQTISATDTMDNSITGSARVAVFAAAADHFRVIGPSSTTAGTAFDLTVIAQDHFNNTAPSYRSTVHFTSSDSLASLPANYIFTATDNGVHTLMGVILRTAGSRTITATDMMTSSITGSAPITVTPSAASSLTVAGFPSPVTAGMAGSFTVTAKDPYGNTATGYRGTVHFTSSDAQALLPTDYTFTPTDNGVHPFSATLKTASTQALTATDKATASITGTQGGIVVNAAATSAFVVTGFPSPITAGMAGNVTVTAKDAYGNVTPAYTGTVHFTSTDPQAVLPTDYAFLAADHGIHTFPATLKTAGPQSLTATDTHAGTISGTQAGILVTPAAPDHFQVTTSVATTVAGAAFDVTVTVQDAYGNTVTSYTGTVHFSSADPYGATLPADYPFTAADHGVHTFRGGATLYTAGAWDVTATDTVRGIAGRATVAVTPATADHFEVDAPDTTVAGQAFDLTVTALDPYGNTDVNYTGTITFSSSDPNAVLPADYTFAAADQGMVVFASGATLFLAGSQSITATDMATGLVTGSALVSVTPAAADHFQVNAPATVAPHMPFDGTVTALDPYGNVDVNYRGTVTFTSSDSDPGVVLPADYTFTDTDSGVAVFPQGFTLVTLGGQTLTTTDVESGVTGTATVTVAPSGAPGAGTSGNCAAAVGAVLARAPSTTPAENARREEGSSFGLVPCAWAIDHGSRPLRLEPPSAARSIPTPDAVWEAMDQLFSEDLFR